MQTKHIHLNSDTKCCTLSTWGNVMSPEQKYYCCSSSVKCVCKKWETNVHLLQTGKVVQKGPPKGFGKKQTNPSNHTPAR